MLRTFAAVSALVWSGASLLGATIYVDASNTNPTPTGSASNPYPSLQQAIAAASPLDSIWVAAGTYVPTQEQQVGVARSKTFYLDEVSIFGGWDGASSGTSRDPSLYTSILSGDIDTSGGADAFHVVMVKASPSGNISTIDGFTIRDGRADDPNAGIEGTVGGGVRLELYALAEIKGCTIFNNIAVEGGAVYMDAGWCRMTNCALSYNGATRGGSVYNLNGDFRARMTSFYEVGPDGDVPHSGGAIYAKGDSTTPSTTELIRCEFSSTQAEVDGGAVWVGGYGDLDVVNSRFVGCMAGGSGGGIWTDFDGHQQVRVLNSIFCSNHANVWGGAINCYGFAPGDKMCGSRVVVTNSSFSGNNAGNAGGGLMLGCSPSYHEVRNSIVWGNTAPTHPQIGDPTPTQVRVDYSDVQGGWSGTGTGNINADPGFDGKCDFHLAEGSVCVGAGSNTFLVADIFDVDGDSNTTEWTPDFDLMTRLIGTNVDMGAFELQ